MQLREEEEGDTRSHSQMSHQTSREKEADLLDAVKTHSRNKTGLKMIAWRKRSVKTQIKE